jgi:hypothetical protein
MVDAEENSVNQNYKGTKEREECPEYVACNLY